MQEPVQAMSQMASEVKNERRERKNFKYRRKVKNICGGHFSLTKRINKPPKQTVQQSEDLRTKFR